MQWSKPTYARKKLSVAFLMIILSAGITADTSPAFGKGDESCPDTVHLALSDRRHGETFNIGETLCYQLELDTPGALAVSAVSGSAGAETKLRLRHRADVDIVEQGVSALILRVLEPGIYVFEVAPQGPQRVLGEHTVTSRFVPDADAAMIGHYYAKDGADEEIEPFIDTSQNTPEPWIRHPGLLVFGSDGHAVVVRPGEVKRHFVRRGHQSAMRFYDLCPSYPSDDPDSLFVCAAPIFPGEHVRRELTSDYTVFTFVLEELRTIRLEAYGNVNTHGVLYDQWGHRLHVAADGNPGGNFRVVGALAPGRYYVRIEGNRGAVGSYMLRIASSAW